MVSPEKLFPSALLLLVSLVSTSCSPDGISQAESTAAPEELQAKLGDLHYHEKSGLSYYVVNSAGAREDTKLPWVIVLHGIAGSAAGSFGLVDKMPFQARFYLLQGPNQFRSGYEWFGAPPSDKGREYGAGILDSSRRINLFISDFELSEVNLGKPLVTGFSQGGILSYALAAYFPDSILAALPISGWLPSSIWPTTEPTSIVPVRALHGSEDSTLPLEATAEAIDYLRTMNMDIDIVVYAGVSHRITSRMKSDWEAEMQLLFVNAGLLPASE